MSILFKFIILSILSLTSLFSANIGTITSITGSAYISRNASNIVALLGAPLNDKDTIITKDKSRVKIIFNDKTIINIGRNSNFSISEYLFEDNKEPIARFSLLKGAIRTITGKIGKIAPDKFIVKTKTATIGIRGTIFSVLSFEDGSTEVFCTYGAIFVEVNNIIITIPKDFYVTVSSTGEVSDLMKFNSDKFDKIKEDNFINEEIIESNNIDNIVDTVNEVDSKIKNASKESIANDAATDTASEAVDAAADIDIDMDMY